MLNILFALNDSAKKEKVEKLFNFILNNTILDKLNVDEFSLSKYKSHYKFYLYRR